MRSQSPQRPWHVLSPVKSDYVPERIIVVAIDPCVSRPAATVQEHTFGRGYARCHWLRDGACVSEQGQYLDRPDDWWRVLDSWRSRRSCTWIFAHNIGYVLCMLGFWDVLDAGGDTLVSAVISDPPTIITTRRQGRLLRYVDTNNYWRDNSQGTDTPPGCSGDNRGEIVGHLPPRGEHAAAKVGNLSAKLLGLLSCLARTRAGSWASTAAGVAWNVYRHSFIANPIYIHGHEACIRLERAALYGGRLESRTAGRVAEPVNAIDCNSMYPAIMASDKHPHKMIGYFDEPTSKQLSHALRGHFCVASVDVVPGHYPLPVRGPKGVLYTTGACRSTLCGRELHAAQQSAAIARVHELAVYETADLFSGYVNYMYPRKLAAKEMGQHDESDFYKLCLNSLSGKFAQKGRQWHDDTQAIAPDRYAVWWGVAAGAARPVRYRAVAGHVQRLESGPEPRHTLPAITAGITAAGRSLLQSAIAMAGESNTHYCDTDSVHVTSVGQHRLYRAGWLHGTALGRWKTVATGADAYYWGPKHYRVGDWWVCNYLSATAHEIAHGAFLQSAMSGLETILGTGVVDRVLVQERTIQLPAGTWDMRQRLRQLECVNHECRESETSTLHKTSQVPSLW